MILGTKISSDSHQQAVFEEQVALLYSGLRVALSITSLVSLFLILVLWPVIDHMALLSWLSVILVLTLVRGISYVLFNKRKQFRFTTRNWCRIFNAGVLLASLSWCASLIWLFPPQSVKLQAFIIIALIGMCSGGVTTLSFRRESALLFIVPILLTLGWVFASQGETWGVGLAAASFLYFIGLFISSRHIFRITLQNIELRLNSRAQSQAQEASEHRLRTILDTEADAFFLHDVDGKFLDVNQQACLSLGYSREELLQLKVKDIEITSNNTEVDLHWDDLENDKTATVTGTHRRKDGSSFPVESRLGVLYEGGKKLFSVLSRDISERQQAEAALKLNEEQARTQFKGMPIPTYIWRRVENDFVLDDYNDAADKFTKGVVKEYIGIKLSVMYADEPEVISDIIKSYDNKISIEKEIEIYFKHARVMRNLAMKYAYIPPDRVIIHSEDISERIKTEKRIQEKQQQLEDAQRIARLGNWDWDLLTGKIEWSDEVFRILGYEKGKHAANQENFIGVLHPDDLPLMVEFEKRAFQGEVSFDEEWRIITPVGELKYINLLGNRVFNEQKQPIRMVGTMQDITERKQVEILKNEFVSSVSHEIRTPLTSIMGSLSIVTSGTLGKLPEETGKLLRIAFDNSKRLLNLINDILDVAKIEAGEFQLTPEPISLLELIEESVSLNEGYANKYHSNIKLDSQISVDTQINADKERIMQVMSNLLSNAMKFTLPETDIEVSVVCNNDWVRVSVKDHGKGIDQAFIPRIFKRFSQSDASNTRVTGGTGLGLNISRQIIEAHHGKIDFETGKKGSTFYFELPVYFPQPTS